MSESIAWSLSAAAASGGIGTSGKVDGDATISLSRTFEPGSGETDIALQVDQVDNVTFLAINSDLLDGSVTVQGSGDKRVLTGPIVLFGEAVKLFATDLSVIKVDNTSGDKVATLKILLGMRVVAPA